MLSKSATKGLAVLGLAARLAMIAISFTVYALNGREMNKVLWNGVGQARGRYGGRPAKQERLPAEPNL